MLLVDCGGAGDPTCGRALEHALAATGHSLSDVRLLVATHTHSDHIGLAELVRAHSGAELWMHRASAHFYDAMRDPELVQAARERRARAEGVPEDLVHEFGDVREETEGVMSPVEPERELEDGMLIPSALGAWEVMETPGHAPSHVCLVQRERGAVILGDLLSPVFAPYFDYGYTPDPVAEFVASLERVGSLGELRVGLPGHGRPIEDLAGAIEDHRGATQARLEATARAVGEGAACAWEITARVFGEYRAGMAGVSRVGEVMAYLRHLRRRGLVARRVGRDGRFSYTLTGPGLATVAAS